MKNRNNRTLYHIPIIHALEELPKKLYKEELGFHYKNFKKDFEKNHKVFWKNIERFLFDKKIDKIYQDSYSFPYLFPLHFVETNEGTPNSKVLLKLIERGLKMVKTDVAFNRFLGRSVDERDSHIAYRINKTLKEGEVGVLFIGEGHNVEEKIKKEYSKIKIISFDAGMKSMINIYKKYFN